MNDPFHTALAHCKNLFSNKGGATAGLATFDNWKKQLIDFYYPEPTRFAPDFIYIWYIAIGNNLYLSYSTDIISENSQSSRYIDDLITPIIEIMDNASSENNDILKLQFSRLKQLLAYAIACLVLNLVAIVAIPWQIWKNSCPLVTKLVTKFALEFIIKNDLLRGLLAIVSLVLSPILYHLIPDKTSNIYNDNETDLGWQSFNSFFLFCFELITTIIMIPLAIIFKLVSTVYHNLSNPAEMPKKIGLALIETIIELFKGVFTLWLPISLVCIALGYQQALLPFGLITYLILGSSVPVITHLALIKTALISFACCYIWSLKQPALFKEPSFQKAGAAAALLLLFLVYNAPITATFVYLKLTGMFLTIAITMANNQLSVNATATISNSAVALQLLGATPAKINQTQCDELSSAITEYKTNP